MQISLPRPAFQDVSFEENTFPEAHNTTHSVWTSRVTLAIFHCQLRYDQKGHNVEEMFRGKQRSAGMEKGSSYSLTKTTNAGGLSLDLHGCLK